MGGRLIATERMRELFDQLSWQGKKDLGNQLGYTRTHVYEMFRANRFRAVVADGIARFFGEPVDTLFTEPQDEAA